MNDLEELDKKISSLHRIVYDLCWQKEALKIISLINRLIQIYEKDLITLPTLKLKKEILIEIWNHSRGVRCFSCNAIRIIPPQAHLPLNNCTCEHLI